VADQLADAGLDVDGRARQLLADRLGEDGGAIVEVIERLRGAFAPGTRIGADDIEPYLSQAGGVPPWELTDTIDKGDVPGALERLDRMLRGGDRHPLAIMASLQSHYLRMLRLDGSDARGEKDAAQILGLKGSTFPAKKALDGARRLGSDRLAQFGALLAEADLDLHGAKAWPPELVIEILVGRLAGRSRAARARR
jgi:DNA polymerase-3 subunit delta